MNTILTDDERPKLPETPYQLYYEWPDDEDGYGGSEVVDGDAYTAEQMEAYADAREAAVLAKLREQEPQDRERWLAVREGHFNAASAEYFNARQHLDTPENRRIFYAGHCKGYDAAPLPAVVQVPPDLKERICEAHDASLDEDHRACRLILMECVRLIDAAAPEAPAQGDPLEKLTRIQEELGLYDDKPAQTSVPAPWREVVKVAREALNDMNDSLQQIAELAHGKSTGPAVWDEYWNIRNMAYNAMNGAALAQLDSLEGGE